MKKLSNSCRCARKYGLVGGLCTLIVFGGQAAAATPPADAPSGPVRLAVLAEDVSPESRALADPLTVELAAVPNVETGERAKFVLANLEL